MTVLRQAQDELLRQAQEERPAAYWREALLEAALRVAGVLAACRPPYLVYRERLKATLAYLNEALDGKAEPELGPGRWAELVLNPSAGSGQAGLSRQELARAALREALAYCDLAGLPRPEAIAVVNAWARGHPVGLSHHEDHEAGA